MHADDDAPERRGGEGEADVATDLDLIGEAIDTDAVLAELDTRWASDTPPVDIDGHRLRPLRDFPLTESTPDGVSNPYWDLVRRLPVSTLSRARPEIDIIWGLLNGVPGACREALARQFAFAVPSPDDIAFLTEALAGRGVVELGAGTGYWAWQLAQAGVDVLAYDSQDWTETGTLSTVRYHPVHTGSIEQAAKHPERTLMLCWPDFDSPFAAEALAAYNGTELIFIGEGPAGATADDDFFDALDRDWDLRGSSPGHINFSGIHSSVCVYRRKRQ